MNAPLTKRALMQRISRKLSQNNQSLKTNRSERWQSDLGGFYIVDNDNNAIAASHVDLEKLGKELGVLKEWESLAE